MTTRFTVQELLQSAKQLSAREFEEFFEKIAAFHGRKKPVKPSKKEAELLEKIRKGLPRQAKERFDFLIAKRDLRTLTPPEYEELLKLTELVESHDLQRLRWMAELAELRGIPLPDVVEEYHLQPNA